MIDLVLRKRLPVQGEFGQIFVVGESVESVEHALLLRTRDVLVVGDRLPDVQRMLAVFEDDRVAAVHSEGATLYRHWALNVATVARKDFARFGLKEITL